MRTSARRREKVSSNDYVIVSYFPLIDKEKLSRGIFENKYISGIHRVFASSYKNKYAHVCIQSDIDGYTFADALKLAKQFDKTERVFFIEEFITAVDFIRIGWYYLYFMSKFLLNISRIRRAMHYQYEGGDYCLWELAKKDICNSFCGEHCVSILFYLFMFRRLCSLLGQKSKIMCICEMQSWEKALYLYAKIEGITTIGVQHTTVSEMLLNYFNTPQDISGSDFVTHCPLPDYLATVGKIPADLLVKYGWPENRIFVWGAQRFENLKSFEKFSYPWRNKKNCFICAFPIDNVETGYLSKLLEEAFKEGKTGYTVLVKPHPAAPNLQAVIKQLESRLNSAVFEFTERSLEVLLSEAKGIIVTESSSSLHALAYGVPVIVPRFAGKLDCNPLSYISDLPLYVYTAGELRQICDMLIASNNAPVPFEKGKIFLREYLYFPSDDAEYGKKIVGLENCLSPVGNN